MTVLFDQYVEHDLNNTYIVCVPPHNFFNQSKTLSVGQLNCNYVKNSNFVESVLVIFIIQ